MLSHLTSERHGYSVKFSPYMTNQLLVATSQLYGLMGGGTLFHFELQNNEIIELQRLEWSDGLFDVTWCPYVPDMAVTSSGDGSLQIWSDIYKPTSPTSSPASQSTSSTSSTSSVTPLICLKEHKNEVYSVDWSSKWNCHQILSASWDGTIKLWDCNRKRSFMTYTHSETESIYRASFAPLMANIFASVGTDGQLNLWNLFDFSGKPLISVTADHGGEILSLAWNEYNSNILSTGGSDGLIRTWDLRNLRHPIHDLYAGEYAVRRLAYSPHHMNLLAAANYDFTTRIWDLGVSRNALEVYENHSEFVCGLDWSPQHPHLLADCGWDSLLNVFSPACSYPYQY